MPDNFKYMGLHKIDKASLSKMKMIQTRYSRNNR